MIENVSWRLFYHRILSTRFFSLHISFAKRKKASEWQQMNRGCSVLTDHQNAFWYNGHVLRIQCVCVHLILIRLYFGEKSISPAFLGS